MSLSSVPIVAVTRCGIGIYDQKWWESRLELLKAITFPSLTRFGDLDFTWHILLDSAVPNNVYAALQEMVQESGCRFVRFSFVDNPAFVREGMFNAVKSVAAPEQRCLAMRIDDDDAVSSDFFENALALALEDPEKPAVISLSRGFAFNAPDRAIGELSYPSHPCNTVFYGTRAELDRIMFRNHVKWLQSAEALGFRSLDVTSKSGQFLYTYHKQGDGSYEKRVSRVEKWRELNSHDVDRFGLKVAPLEAWVEKQKSLPKTVGLTWRRAQGERWQLDSLKAEMQRLKREIIKTNSKIFDPAEPFLYMLKPLNGTKVRAGTVSFTGTSNAGATVSMSVTGKTGIYRTVQEVTADETDGNFKLVGRFKPGTWNIRILSTMTTNGEEKRKQLDYQIVAS
ncbi:MULTISPECIES: glycosyltransferase [Corynebacterium]|uniref:Uncharacterized protein n=2 Tax=Corynebacterium TaxID=1716 RepID=A0A269PFV7_9CORY|nr:MULTISPECIES: glycosyltransferase [Corynebacterium]PAJ71069.1 hypothetical protein CIG21_02565 [Corynebacterium hadale]RMD20008.1 hypothetical protein EAW56_03535 [Corynebacterium gottingense]WJZ13631.1 hypothetical protein CGOTT_08585 [Corynebacterium gottingense]WJZ15946.1 hypothetical protein CGOTTB_08535 [Corynebacterium gottingense]WKC60646.1 hypothetical protein CHAD_08940 [Corynebacterium hadale]